MASQPQPLCPTVPCASPTGTGVGRLASSSPERGSARPKPPLRPKPRVLPKPAVPTKPPLAQPPPAPRNPRPELPSAEKMNRLAGPQPYSGGGTGGLLRRPSFTFRGPETPIGKGSLPPLVTAAEDCSLSLLEGVPPAPLTPSRKGPAPFKVTPVPVATKPERFPGTTVEEILAKMEREDPGSPERARLSPFCPDPSSRFGSKTFSAFRRRPSGEGDRAPPGEALLTPLPTAGKLGTRDKGHPIVKTSSSPPAGLGCAGDPCGHWRPPSPPDLSSLQSGTFGPPGSPRTPTCPAPGAPFQPAKPSTSAPGSPDAPPELPAPGLPTLAPSSSEPSAQPPPGIPAPGAPFSSTQPQRGASHSPGSPHTPGEGSPDTSSPPATPELPPRVTCPPGSPEAATEPPVSPSPPPEPSATASRPPGSPEGPNDSLEFPEGPDSNPPAPSQHLGHRHSSEGALQPPPVGQGLEGLRGSLSTLPCPGDPLPDTPLGSSSSWSLSQSFEWTFPSRGAQQLASPPCSPISETTDPGLSEEGESDGGDWAPPPPCSQGDSSFERPGPTVGAPGPGGPVAQKEAGGLGDEGEAEGGVTLSHSTLDVTEPIQDPAQPQPPAEEGQDSPDQDPRAPTTPTDCPSILQGPGAPGRAEGPSRNPDTHGDPGWLMELLVSPGPHSTGHGSVEAPEGLLGWSRKDLCSAFGIGRPAQPGAFGWTHRAAGREGDWPSKTQRHRELQTQPGWDGTRHPGEGDHQDWGSDGQGRGLGCSDWSQPPGAVESGDPQDQEFGAGKPKWGTSYGSGEQSGCRKADWSHSQQQDQETSSGQSSWAGGFSSGDPESRDRDVRPGWAGEYGSGDMGMKERELTPAWASKYSSRDTKTEDFTLGWAGRTSTGDTGTPEKEFSPSRAAWDSRYSTRDMESQDREFSPSRPARAGDYSTQDMESQDREFSPSRPAEDGENSSGDVETQAGDFTRRRPTWDNGYSSRDTESQDRDFKANRPTWDDGSRSGDVESQDRDFTLSRPAWDEGPSTRDLETQDRDFIAIRPSWDDGSRSRELETQDRDFKESRPSWDDGSSTRDVETQDRDFKESRPSWDDGSSTRDVDDQDSRFRPDRPVWDVEYSTRVVETQDKELKPSRPAWDEYCGQDLESQDLEFSPSRAAAASEDSRGDVGTRDGEFSSNRPAWGDGYSSREVESQNQEFSPRQAAEASEQSSRDMESQDGDFTPSREAWDDGATTRDTDNQERDFTPSRAAWSEGYSTQDMESQDREFSPSRRTGDSQDSSGEGGTWGGVFNPSRVTWEGEYRSRGTESEDQEFGPSRPAWPSQLSSGSTALAARGFSAARQSWAGEQGGGQAGLDGTLGVGKDNVPIPLALELGWGSTRPQDWAEGPGGAELGVTGTERELDPSRTSLGGSVPWAGGVGAGGLLEPLGGWGRGLSFSSSEGAGLVDPGWSQELDGAMGGTEPQDTEAKRREWAEAFGARCAARNRDCGEQSPGGNSGTMRGSTLDPSLLEGDTPAVPLATEHSQSESPSPTKERDVSEMAAAPPSPPASPLLPRTAGDTLPDMENQGVPLGHPDGKSPQSGEEEGLPQPEGPPDHTKQEFTFLEDTEVLDSRLYRSKANLGRQRSPRPPALRPAATPPGDSWIFRDSTDPRPCPPAVSSDEEAAEEPRSRRARGPPLGRGVRVPLFPGLSTSALKAKLRGRNRSVEEGASAGDSKATPPRDPHVQRSKSCKIPSWSGRPPALPPKPERSSGSDSSPPHWLQALKLKKKKP
ncbi:LOW QUALITY PROTEIN: 182 kDa tankyrase-1-binding protein [Heliangelus exortis]|uniref:LOW QUALITY PROTEIN: 182 kDa tankyrase-1-binding protein n=1 Tax=Heliangelus exortis TaxID=472823 RepID=UPI003A948782